MDTETTLLPDEAAQKKAARKETFFQTVKYFCFAASAGAIQTGSFALLTDVVKVLPHWANYLISLVLSVLWNFSFNRKFTFKDAGNIPIAMLKVAGYYLVFTPLSTWLNKVIGGTDPAEWLRYTLFVSTLLVNGITEFLFYKFVVFPKKKPGLVHEETDTAAGES
ncbi:MAG: GtrA family protein [Oscillospiraceae bacterium]|jgi:putative flippase GtrA|nr:GtrA family protein [Oscillospiraceae bacterium]